MLLLLLLLDDKHGNDEEDEDAYGYELVYMVLAATAVAGRIRDLPVDNTIACCGILTRIVISAIGLGLATKTNANALFMMVRWMMMIYVQENCLHPPDG